MVLQHEAVTETQKKEQSQVAGQADGSQAPLAWQIRVQRKTRTLSECAFIDQP